MCFFYRLYFFTVALKWIMLKGFVYLLVFKPEIRLMVQGGALEASLV